MDDTTPCQIPQKSLMTQSISELQIVSDDEVVQQSRNRSQACIALFAKYTAASGEQIDTARRRAIIEMLHADSYTHAQFQAAEQWILKGAPCRYGKITLADFFPTREQLESIGYDIAAIERRAHEAGYRIGFDAGVAQTTEMWREEVRAARQLSGKI